MLGAVSSRLETPWFPMPIPHSCMSSKVGVFGSKVGVFGSKVRVLVQGWEFWVQKVGVLGSKFGLFFKSRIVVQNWEVSGLLESTSMISCGSDWCFVALCVPSGRWWFFLLLVSEYCPEYQTGCGWVWVIPPWEVVCWFEVWNIQGGFFFPALELVVLSMELSKFAQLL